MTMKGANYLEKLLDNQPVEWKKLGEVCEFQNGYAFKSSLFKETGLPIIRITNINGGGITDEDYKYFDPSDYPKRVEEYRVVQGDILVGMSGSIKIGWYDKENPAYLNQRVGRFIPKIETINKRFLYHYLRLQETNLYLMAGGGIQPNLSSTDIKRKLLIPLPPLSVQSRIVEILDKFTSLEAELEAELDCRKRQYIYYRERLLDFSQHNNIQWKKLGEVAQYSKGRIDASTLSAKNYVGVDNLLQDCQGKKLSEHVPTEGRCTAYSPKDILIGNIRPYLKKIWFADNAGGTNGDVLVIQTTDERVLPEYLYQVLSDDAFFTYDMQHAKGAKMPRGNKDKILDYKIPIPPLSEQARIVEILDKFDTLTNSISEGLPLEIQLRKQQYEYYREQLLDFRR